MNVSFEFRGGEFGAGSIDWAKAYSLLLTTDTGGLRSSSLKGKATLQGFATAI